MVIVRLFGGRVAPALRGWPLRLVASELSKQDLTETNPDQSCFNLAPTEFTRIRRLLFFQTSELIVAGHVR